MFNSTTAPSGIVCNCLGACRPVDQGGRGYCPIGQPTTTGERTFTAAHLAAVLADVETVEAVAEAIHSHMKAVRDRGDYIVGPASDDAARAAIAVIGARLGLT